MHSLYQTWKCVYYGIANGYDDRYKIQLINILIYDLLEDRLVQYQSNIFKEKKKEHFSANAMIVEFTEIYIFNLLLPP